MQMRFDGQLGFPGGYVDELLTGLELEEAHQKVAEAVARELREEVNYDTDTHPVGREHYLFSSRYINHRGPIFLHFYAQQV